MKLSKLKQILNSSDEILIHLPDGNTIPKHFHVTEVGLSTKHFIDCGGTVRDENKITIQLWEAEDYEHRILPEKLLKIIEISESKLNLPDAEIEVEYQGDTIQKFGLDHENEYFSLTSLHTDCLAKDSCGTSPSKDTKQKIQLVDFGENMNQVNACSPGGDVVKT